MANTIHFSGTHEQLRTLLGHFVAALSGRTGNFAPYVRGIKLRVGMVALRCIQIDFVTKAAGGTGEDGITWPALKKETVANRRVGPGDDLQGATKHRYGYGNRKQGPGDLDILGRLKRGFLTAEQDKRWKRIFSSRLFMLMGKHGMGEAEAKARAAQIAWATLKAEGAKTKLEVLGDRKVQIGRDTGRLFNSLSPGIAEPEQHPLLENPPPPLNGDLNYRILREAPGAIIVGTNVIYAGKFHAMRPLWPVSLPAPWSEQIAHAAKTGVLEAVGMILEGRG